VEERQPLTREEWWEVGRMFGYSKQGLNGFLKGANAGVRREADQYVLSEAGRQWLDQVGRLPTQADERGSDA